jgi:hypothetical protein
VQKNFTDPESRIMKSKDGLVQAYNAQIAVDSAAQIIVAQDVVQSPIDSGQLVPMTDAVETNLGRKPEQLSADASYCSEANSAGGPCHRWLCDNWPGEGTRLPVASRPTLCRIPSAGAGTGGKPASRAHASGRALSRRSHAGEDQGGRPRKPRSATQPTARAGVRTN